MTKRILIIAMVLCAVILSVKAFTNSTAPKTADCACCKNCNDDKCKELCQTWSNMSSEVQKSAEGQKVKAECLSICKERNCCSPDGTCPGMEEGKSCCKKK
jgi:hypothetical protein